MWVRALLSWGPALPFGSGRMVLSLVCSGKISSCIIKTGISLDSLNPSIRLVPFAEYFKFCFREPSLIRPSLLQHTLSDNSVPGSVLDACSGVSSGQTKPLLHGAQALEQLLPCFVNKALLAPGHAHLCMYRLGCFCAATAELSSILMETVWSTQP